MINRSYDSNGPNSFKRDIFKISYDGNSVQTRSKQFFSSICGLDDIKENVYRALSSDEQVNILLVGRHKEIKSKFINHLLDQCHDVFYFNVNARVGPELLSELFAHRLAKIIIIDNIDRLQKKYLNSLHNFLDKGKIKLMRSNKEVEFNMKNIKVIATIEDLSKLSPQLRSRFMDYQIS